MIHIYTHRNVVHTTFRLEHTGARACAKRKTICPLPHVRHAPSAYINIATTTITIQFSRRVHVRHMRVSSRPSRYTVVRNEVCKGLIFFVFRVATCGCMTTWPPSEASRQLRPSRSHLLWFYVAIRHLSVQTSAKKMILDKK